MTGKLKAPRLSEADLEKACTELLAWDNWRPLKTDPVSQREWGKGFGEIGMADHLYIRYQYFGGSLSLPGQTVCQVMWIEWKRRGGKPRAEQKVWIQAERARGGVVILAGRDFEATVEGFLAWYRPSGLNRRPI